MEKMEVETCRPPVAEEEHMVDTVDMMAVAEKMEEVKEHLPEPRREPKQRKEPLPLTGAVACSNGDLPGGQQH